MKCNSIVKKYPNGTLKVKKTKFFFECGSKQRQDMRYADNSDYAIALDRMHKLNYEDRENYLTDKVKDNMIKTKEKIYDIANSNEFNYFITLTYSSEKCDRFSFEETSKKVRKFMNNYKNKNDDKLKYLLVHECHKNGAYHYHGLVYLSDESKLVDSTKRDNKKRIIYNWQSWKNGFSTVTKIDNLEACRNYVLKYIEKDLDKDYVKGQRRFYYSKNCSKPVKENTIDYDVTGLELLYESQFSIGYQKDIKDSDYKNLLGTTIEVID